MFTVSCESTTDIPYSYLLGRNVPVLFYSCVLGNEQIEDNMGRNPNVLEKFYNAIKDGAIPSTSQITEPQYEEFFEPLLKNGDLLHIVFSSGLTKSYENALLAAKSLAEKYPNRKIEIIDSLCACGGYGMLVDYAADMRDAGGNIDELKSWLTENRLRIQHRFFSTDLKYYRRSGRVSGPAAAVASVLNLCPVMHLDNCGKIIAHGKVRGVCNAVENTVSAMAELAENGTDYNGKCYIFHSNCVEKAAKLKEAVESKFKNLKGKTVIGDIGMIIASHCGPNTVAIFFFGSPREA